MHSVSVFVVEKHEEFFTFVVGIRIQAVRLRSPRGDAGKRVVGAIPAVGTYTNIHSELPC